MNLKTKTCGGTGIAVSTAMMMATAESATIGGTTKLGTKDTIVYLRLTMAPILQIAQIRLTALLIAENQISQQIQLSQLIQHH